MKKLAIFVLVFMFLPVISSNYITGDIYVNEQGKATFYVETDKDVNIQGITFSGGVLRGATDFLTSKSGDTWTFLLNSSGYEIILLDIHLPKNTYSVFSLLGVDSLFDVDEKIITLIGDDESLIFEVSYKIEDKNFYWFVLWILMVIAGFILFYFIFDRFLAKKRRLKQAFPYINDKEKAILDLLMKGDLRQNNVRKSLNIPKASFSRYVVNLEKKKLIIREGDGKNKILRLR